jgi:uncharacterized glyoxalase superfamily protein PhnB
VRLLFEVQSADEEFERLSKYPLDVVEPPTDRTWGHRSFRLRDPDGVVVTLYERLRVAPEAPLGPAAERA